MIEFPSPPPFGDERDMLLAFLDLQRATLIWKLDGLSDGQLRQPHEVTDFSLLGLLKHLIRTERTWFQLRLTGEQVDGQPNDDTAWSPGDEESFELLVLQYREACRRSNEIARSLPLDQYTIHHSANYGPVTLQWVLFHMIEETARHLGHADVIRQSIDGATGVNPLHGRGHVDRGADAL